jgi:misacylated tRNA(Ala) deacylase
MDENKNLNEGQLSTQLVFLYDSYLKELDAKIIGIQSNALILDKTIFYYTSGGQPNDKGEIFVKELNQTFIVDNVQKKDGLILHYISNFSNSLSVGMNVRLKLDWERRYRLMRMHTASHVLSSVFFKHNILISGNQLDVDKTRFDFNIENFNSDFMKECINQANEICSMAKNVKIYFLDVNQALKIPGLIKLAGKSLPENLKEIRIVEIEDVDIQADGGTHLKNTSEVGKLVYLKSENKGKNFRRVYFTLEP